MGHQRCVASVVTLQTRFCGNQQPSFVFVPRQWRLLGRAIDGQTQDQVLGAQSCRYSSCCGVPPCRIVAPRDTRRIKQQVLACDCAAMVGPLRYPLFSLTLLLLIGAKARARSPSLIATYAVGAKIIINNCSATLTSLAFIPRGSVATLNTANQECSFVADMPGDYVLRRGPLLERCVAGPKALKGGQLPPLLLLAPMSPMALASSVSNPVCREGICPGVSVTLHHGVQICLFAAPLLDRSAASHHHRFV